MRHMERIALLEYVPELSLLIAGSQGCACLLLVKLVRNSKTKEYAMLPERVLPSVQPPSPIVGMTVTRHVLPIGALSHFKLYILYQNKSLYCYELRRASNQLDISAMSL